MSDNNDQENQASDERGGRPDAEARRLRSLENLTFLLRQSGLSLEQLSEQSGVDLPTLRRWRREGFLQPKQSHLDAVARVFSIANPRALVDSRLEEVQPPASPPSNRPANPMVDEVRHNRPELFDQFQAEDWDELISNFGVGGALTYDGVVHFVEKINRKRELRRKFEVLLETHHFRLLEQLIDVFYRDTSVR